MPATSPRRRHPTPPPTRRSSPAAATTPATNPHPSKRSPPDEPATEAKETAPAIAAPQTTPTEDTPAPATAPAAPASRGQPAPALLSGARIVATAHEKAHGEPITPGQLAVRLRVPTQTAADILTALTTQPTINNRPTTAPLLEPLRDLLDAASRARNHHGFGHGSLRCSRNRLLALGHPHQHHPQPRRRRVGTRATTRTVASGRARAQDPDYPEWLGHVRAASACKHPIRLAGQIHVNNADGNRMATIDTEDMPDGAIYTPCGNRRAAVCPSCAELYRRDTYHLIKAGLQGDRWGIPPLNEHIAIFLTATAPSFGPVHHRVVKMHAADCRKKDGCTCRPSLCHPFGRTCPHGARAALRATPQGRRPHLGQPMCLDCYDHVGQVVWNHEAPELWRRTIQQADRELRRLGRSPRRRPTPPLRQGLRIPGPRRHPLPRPHPPRRLQPRLPRSHRAAAPRHHAGHVRAAVRTAFLKTAYTSAAHPANSGQGWRIGWGTRAWTSSTSTPPAARSTSPRSPATSPSTSPRAPRSPA